MMFVSIVHFSSGTLASQTSKNAAWLNCLSNAVQDKPTNIIT